MQCLHDSELILDWHAFCNTNNKRDLCIDCFDNCICCESWWDEHRGGVNAYPGFKDFTDRVEDRSTPEMSRASFAG